MDSITIVFTGMMMIVRHGKVGSADILAVRPKGGMTHLPRLAVPLDSVASISDRLLTDVITDPQGRVFGIVDLMDKSVTIEEGQWSSGALSVDECGNDAYGQVLDFDRLGSPMGPISAEAPVTMKITLDHGSMRVKTRGEDTDGNRIAVTFQPPSAGNAIKAMKEYADVVEWNAEGGRGFAVLIKPGGEITFRDKTVTLAVSNLPADPVKELRSPVAFMDFKGYYDLFTEGSKISSDKRRYPIQEFGRVGLMCIGAKCFMATVSR
jgi:hypothetical protein